MNCPKCSTENLPQYKFCVSCGTELHKPPEPNPQKNAAAPRHADMGGYRSENDSKNKFTISEGTFKISDRAPKEDSGMFSSEELDTGEEFDFSNIDEPFIPKLDADRIKIPTAQTAPQPVPTVRPSPIPQPAARTLPQPQFIRGAVPMPQQNKPAPQPVPNVGAPPPMPNTAVPQPHLVQPRFVGYDSNGMPVYAQPVPQQMYAQPVIVGYDPSGMPIYAQPSPQMLYGQPVIVGYDRNGIPIYGQPVPQQMYAQPMNINNPSAPVYGAPVPKPPTPQQPQAPPQTQHTAPEPQDKVNISDRFWDDFFSDSNDDGKDDFFSSSGDEQKVSDLGSKKKSSSKKIDYMGDLPSVDAANLKPAESDKINKLYMRNTNLATKDLGEKKNDVRHAVMHQTNVVNADDLAANEHKKTRITMHQAGEANADDLEAYERGHREALMEQADHAVEALPKKKHKQNADEVKQIPGISGLR